MNTLHLAFDPASGPIVGVEVGLAAVNVLNLRAAGRPVPPAVQVSALIDTGADITCLAPGVMAPFVSAGLIVGQITLTNAPGVSGNRVFIEYAIGLVIPHPSGSPRASLTIRSMPVIEMPLQTLGYQALIGRDVLAHCLLVYDGRAGRFTLAY